MRAPGALRREQSRLLIQPSARTIRWMSFAVIGALGGLVVWTGGRKGDDPAAVAMPIATTLLCVWLCFLFEDLAAETTAASATPLLFRRAVRAAIAIPAVGALWFTYTWVGPLSGPTGVMAGSLAAEIVLALAAASVAARAVGAVRGGFAASAAVVLVTLIVPLAIATPPSVDPASPPFGDPLPYWAATAMVSVLVLGLAHVEVFRRR